MACRGMKESMQYIKAYHNHQTMSARKIMKGKAVGVLDTASGHVQRWTLAQAAFNKSEVFKDYVGYFGLG